MISFIQLVQRMNLLTSSGYCKKLHHFPTRQIPNNFANNNMTVCTMKSRAFLLFIKQHLKLPSLKVVTCSTVVLSSQASKYYERLLAAEPNSTPHQNH